MIAMANRKHLTSRDIKLIDFLEENNLIITAELAAQYFYRSPTDNFKSALTVAQRRLALCCDRVSDATSSSVFIAWEYVFKVTATSL